MATTAALADLAFAMADEEAVRPRLANLTDVGVEVGEEVDEDAKRVEPVCEDEVWALDPDDDDVGGGSDLHQLLVFTQTGRAPSSPDIDQGRSA